MKYENGIETKNLILETSQRLFFSKGFKETSIREIAHHSHITSGALYKHFKNKEHILETIIEPYIKKWWAICNESLKNWEERQDKIKDKKDIALLFKDYYNYPFYELVTIHNDVWQFIFFKSSGTKYENFFDEFMDWEIDNTLKMLEKLNPNKHYNQILSDKELKNVLTGFINMLAQGLNNNFSKTERAHYYKVVNDIFTEFWKKIFMTTS